jgi:predicted enzyme related to lactoylglutathione lyase
MGQRTSYAPGTFSWVDLATTDPEAAKQFYGRLFGWQAEDMPAGDAGTYTMLRRDGAYAAALYAQSEDQRKAGMPPAWVSYVTVQDADATATRAAELGATVLAGPFDVVQAGRMAVIADPQGAAFAVWQPREHIGAQIVNQPGALTWNDLLTTDVDAAATFYRDLLGWEVEQVGEMPYWMIRNGGASNGGLMPIPDDQRSAGVSPVWNAYFAVDDLDEALRTVQAGGGELVAGPIDMDAGRFAAVRDPQGAALSLFAGRLDA